MRLSIQIDDVSAALERGLTITIGPSQGSSTPLADGSRRLEQEGGAEVRRGVEGDRHSIEQEDAADGGMDSGDNIDAYGMCFSSFVRVQYI